MKPLRILHLSDTHFGPDSAFELYRTKPSENFAALKEAILADRLDFERVVFTGDLVDRPVEGAYELARPFVTDWPVPVHVLPGNHDGRLELREALADCLGEPLMPETGWLSYALEVGGIHLLFLDTRLPDDCWEAQGEVGEAQLEALRRWFADTEGPVAVFGHWPALPMDAEWIRTRMLLRDGEAFHELLCAQRDRLLGYFFGHVHRPIQQYVDGLLYASSGSTFCQLSHRPTDGRPDIYPGQRFAQLIYLDPPRGAVLKTLTY